MSSTNSYAWEEFNRELAKKLLPYKNNRQELISKIKNAYKNADLELPTLERGEVVDIDPFTIFALFNKDLGEDNRIKIVRAFAKEFAVTDPIPESFKGVPRVDNRNATFYAFIDQRGEGDIDDLWALFKAALDYSDNQNPSNKKKFSSLFDLVINKKGNGTGKVTMALYWISPEVYLSLDSRSLWYIYDFGKMPSELVQTLPPIKSGKKIASSTYFDLIEKLRDYLQTEKSSFNSFKDLCAEAWQVANIVNEEEKAKKKNVAETASKKKTKKQPEENTANGDSNVQYWIFSPGEQASEWDEFYNAGIMGIDEELGNLSNYSSRKEIQQKLKGNSEKEPSNRSLAAWEFVHKIKPGDIVFAKKGTSEIIGQGIVESDYVFDPNRKSYKHIRQVKWTHKGKWEHPGKAITKALTDITPYPDYVAQLSALFNDDNDLPDSNDTGKATGYSKYAEKDFLEDVFMSEESYKLLVGLIKKKKNVILQGAPGVGKTYAAKRLAYSILGKKDDARIMTVQFHQSYSYEDFIMGFRPSENGFELKTGAFYNFCKKAADDRDNDYFFIVDEINRGNLSKIFGELFMLVEKDKRGETYSIPLLYSESLSDDEKTFFVPENVYIIGTMNTADRSLAMLDYALRRRFAFFNIEPGFETDGFQKYQEGLTSTRFEALVNQIINLNKKIAEDDSLGEGFCIGHSYFCDLDQASADQALAEIVEYEVIPLLKEYWFDDSNKVKEWSNNLRNAIK